MVFVLSKSLSFQIRLPKLTLVLGKVLLMEGIQHQLIGSLSHYYIPGGDRGISEPSTLFCPKGDQE